MAIICNGFVVVTPPKTNKYWDANIVTTTFITSCTNSVCTSPANNETCVYIYGETVTSGTYTVTVNIYKDGNLYKQYTKQTNATSGNILLIVLDTGMWFMSDDWGKIDIGRNLTLPEGTYTFQVTRA